MHDTYDRSAPDREQNDYTGKVMVLLPSTPNHFGSSIYSREKVWQSPNLFGSGILKETVYFQTFR
jgi:hypothetical protein